MSITPITPSPSDLGKAVFEKADADCDGRLSPQEFQSFLQRLLDRTENQQIRGVGAAHTAQPSAKSGTPLHLTQVTQTPTAAK